MGAVTIRNIPDDVHRALKARAMQNNRGTEAELRAILEIAAESYKKKSFGEVMADIVARAGVTNEDVDAMMENIRAARDPRPREPIRFE